MFLDKNELLTKAFKISQQDNKISCQEEEIDIYSPVVNFLLFFFSIKRLAFMPEPPRVIIS